MNNVVLIGRLTKEIELKYTQSGTAVASFNLAVQRSFKNANGEYETDFIMCQIWRKAAENLANFTHKGSLIAVGGSVQTRNYENNEGQRVYVTEINVSEFQLLERKKDSQNNSQNYDGDVQSSSEGNHTGTNQNANSGQYGANTGTQFGGYANTQNNTQSLDVKDDDLPF